MDIHAVPEKVESLGVMERWDGKMGVGLWNASVCMGRQGSEYAVSQVFR